MNFINSLTGGGHGGSSGGGGGLGGLGGGLNPFTMFKQFDRNGDGKVYNPLTSFSLFIVPFMF